MQIGYLYSLWLEPAVRGGGLAHDLIAAALEWARTLADTDAMAGDVAMAVRVG